jgi:hypothetical protein
LFLDRRSITTRKFTPIHWLRTVIGAHDYAIS